jgi:hypothetical protein
VYDCGATGASTHSGSAAGFGFAFFFGFAAGLAAGLAGAGFAGFAVRFGFAILGVTGSTGVTVATPASWAGTAVCAGGGGGATGEAMSSLSAAGVLTVGGAVGRTDGAGFDGVGFAPAGLGRLSRRFAGGVAVPAVVGAETATVGAGGAAPFARGFWGRLARSPREASGRGFAARTTDGRALTTSLLSLLRGAGATTSGMSAWPFPSNTSHGTTAAAATDRPSATAARTREREVGDDGGFIS